MKPDHTKYVAHFTKGEHALANLTSILRDECIRAGTMPWTNQRAVCFTECPWSSLVGHAEKYSAYGIGFGKHHVFAAGGGPVYYVRADHFRKQMWDSEVYPFVTPFWPSYRPQHLKSPDYLNVTHLDYSHEREWRVAHDFKFDPARVEFVILNTYEDMAQFPKELKDKVGRDKFILMDIYRKIEDLWPTHIVD
jgi:hypothetical protein